PSNLTGRRSRRAGGVLPGGQIARRPRSRALRRTEGPPATRESTPRLPGGERTRPRAPPPLKRSHPSLQEGAKTSINESALCDGDAVIDRDPLELLPGLGVQPGCK